MNKGILKSGKKSIEDSAYTPKIRYLAKNSVEYDSDSDEEMRRLEQKYLKGTFSRK